MNKASQLDGVEKMCVLLYSTPNLAEHLDCLKFRKDFPDSVNEVSNRADAWSQFAYMS